MRPKSRSSDHSAMCGTLQHTLLDLDVLSKDTVIGPKPANLISLVPLGCTWRPQILGRGVLGSCLEVLSFGLGPNSLTKKNGDE